MSSNRFKPSPSTPNRKNRFFSSNNNPSTTPAGPPPSYLTNASTTPFGPPPRSIFGSSVNPPNTFGRSAFGRRAGNTPARRGFAVPESSPADVEEDEEEEDEDEDAEGEEDEEMDLGGDRGGEESMAGDKSAFMSSIMSNSPRGLKRSRNGQVREQVGSDYAAIARGFASHALPANLSEPDDVLLREEEIMSRMEATKSLESAQEGAAQLTKLWSQYANATTKEGSVGPESDDALSKATYLSTLLLQLHTPHRLKPTATPAPPSQRFPAPRKPPSTAAAAAGTPTTIPRALLDWLDTYHNPFPDDFAPISQHQPSPSAHERFWDSIFASLCRGKFEQALSLLKYAGWEHAVTAEDDAKGAYSGAGGYSGRQLDNIEEVVDACVRLIESCPALRDGDWDVKGPAWALFRQRARQALRSLEQFAGGEDDDEDEPAAQGANVFAMSSATRRAESKVPWTIYTNLRLAYDILLGSADEITDASQDWLEACVYITAWWDGEDSSTTSASASLGKSGLRKSLTASARGQQKTREVDLAPSAAYRAHLAASFAFVTDTDEAVFTPETVDPVHVGLGCILSDHPSSAIALLRTMSLPVAAGVVEVAALGGWLPQSRPPSRGLLEQGGFSTEDLMVLSHGPGGMQASPSALAGGEVVRDDVLLEYADSLAGKFVLRSNDGKTEREGWELAVSVLGRLDDEAMSQRKIAELLDRIELSDEKRVDRILSACLELELVEQARGIAERYADTLASSPTPQSTYGAALLYYARAHAAAKLKDALALLTSLCLLHSAAIPAQVDLDTTLFSLLSRDRTALVQLARADADAARLLASHLSGYATVRRFYELRDREAGVVSGKGSGGTLERTRSAASALVAVLESASDCIRGGLYDPEIESVVPVDGVLVLLGECLPLLGQAKRVFTREQVFGLLRVVEDFETSPSRLRENGGSLLQASMTAYRGGSSASMTGTGSSSGSRSELMGGSSYDMLASSTMVRSQQEKGKKGGKGVEVMRAWDWRKGFDAVAGMDGGAREVLLLVRTALAREVGRGWTGQISW